MGEGRRAIAAPDPRALATDRDAALTLLGVSRETSSRIWQRLDDFAALLLEWQRHTNLIAASTLPQLWTRHIADSLQLLRLAPNAKTWVDLGAGAGFPGMVIACAVADVPGAKVHLVESTRKKCTFLAEAVQRTGVPAVVHCERIEVLAPQFTGRIDAVTARALAPLDKLLGLAAPLLKTGTVGLFPKGQDVAVELTEASKCWNIDAVIEPSITSPASGIVVVRKLGRRAASSLRR